LVSFLPRDKSSAHEQRKQHLPERTEPAWRELNRIEIFDCYSMPNVESLRPLEVRG